VEQFDDVSNATGGTTPGNVTFHTHGLPWRDPIITVAITPLFAVQKSDRPDQAKAIRELFNDGKDTTKFNRLIKDLPDPLTPDELAVLKEIVAFDPNNLGNAGQIMREAAQKRLAARKNIPVLPIAPAPRRINTDPVILPSGLSPLGAITGIPAVTGGFYGVKPNAFGAGKADPVSPETISLGLQPFHALLGSDDFDTRHEAIDKIVEIVQREIDRAGPNSRIAAQIATEVFAWTKDPDPEIAYNAKLIIKSLKNMDVTPFGGF
jgi:hypothetical protein